MLFACGGCQQLFGLDAPTLEPPDAAVDAGIDAVTTTCVGEGNLLVCVPIDLPAMLPTNSFTVIDTDAPCAVVDPAHPTWCIMAAREVVISSGLRAKGSRPLVIVALGSLTVTAAGSIDVASSIGKGSGAGAALADPSSCDAGTAGTQGNNGGGGGAGGSFHTRGGAGGGGDIGLVPGGMAGAKITVTMQPPALRGGCPGAAGGAGASGTNKAGGGAGGGAVYLAAAVGMRIDGTINASGAGGVGGLASKGGGGGGGSGGMIALWAPSIVTSIQVFASGGGGGGGADNGAPGVDGGEAGVARSAPPGGLGGAATSCANGPGCGGAGAIGGTVIVSPDGSPGGDDHTGAGGGGGGGGRGLIYTSTSGTD
jgi:hypothetical protein